MGIVGTGGAQWLGVVSGLLINARHGLLALAVAPVAGPGVARKALAAHLVVEGSALAATAQDGVQAARRAFWLTGGLVFVLHLVGTGVGAVTGSVLGDLRAIGMDAAVPAVFVGLLRPALRHPPQLATAIAGGVIATAGLYLVPASIAVLAAAGGAGVGLAVRRRWGGPA